ncbi:MAG: ankyrin repeat domain-containing protein, partial [Alphaproteobacteria bacterium]|nr:ankyrin repeat domain-containing protein [Alphaproteobacteria bacterium]
ALLLAAQNEDKEMFMLLLKEGVDLSHSDKNFNTALLLAAEMQDNEMFSLLKSWQEKQSGLNVRQVQTKQKFPLMNKANEHIKE